MTRLIDNLWKTWILMALDRVAAESVDTDNIGET